MIIFDHKELKNLRDQLGFSQGQFCQEINQSFVGRNPTEVPRLVQPTLSAWETGRQSPTGSHLEIISFIERHYKVTLLKDVSSLIEASVATDFRWEAQTHESTGKVRIDLSFTVSTESLPATYRQIMKLLGLSPF